MQDNNTIKLHYENKKIHNYFFVTMDSWTEKITFSFVNFIVRAKFVLSIEIVNKQTNCVLKK